MTLTTSPNETPEETSGQGTGARCSDAAHGSAAGLSAVPAFAALSADLLRAVEEASTQETYEPGDTVFTMGQTDDALYLVVRGEARMTRADGERGDITVETVGPGGFVGLVPFALGDRSMGTASLQAVGVVEAIAFDTDALRALAETHAPLALALMRLCAEAARDRKRTLDPSARVYRHLLSLVRKSAGGAAIPEMPRHATLAEAAGVSDVEAAGAVAELISRGIARRAYPGLAILDTGALHRAASH